MVVIALRTGSNVIHKFKIAKGDRFLSTLDIFLKKHKLNFTDLHSVLVECIDGEVMGVQAGECMAPSP